jgi:hypothetical protein
MAGTELDCASGTEKLLYSVSEYILFAAVKQVPFLW